MFSFFSTTKEGTSMGLRIVKKIAYAHNGYIKILDNGVSECDSGVAMPMD
jgi:nitrogen fixation/metabolism regulation signal transduction histidine kinase